MSPTIFLLLAVILTTGAACAALAAERRRRAALRRLAEGWQMHYTPYDRFRLAARVAPRLPAPGAAAVRVKDLIYGLEGADIRYIFIAHYTTGTVSAERRHAAVVTFAEPRERRENLPVELLVAPEQLPVLEQYEHLHKRLRAGTTASG
jgi:hypothetical protein